MTNVHSTKHLTICFDEIGIHRDYIGSGIAASFHARKQAVKWSITLPCYGVKTSVDLHLPRRTKLLKHFVEFGITSLRHRSQDEFLNIQHCPSKTQPSTPGVA